MPVNTGCLQEREYSEGTGLPKEDAVSIPGSESKASQRLKISGETLKGRGKLFLVGPLS